MSSSRQQGFAAPFALVTGFGALFALGTLAAALHAWFPPTVVLIAAAAVVTVLAFVAEPLAAVPLGVVGWLTAVGFSHPPYAQLRPTGPPAAHAALVLASSALAGASAGLLFRWSARRFTLGAVGIDAGPGGGGRFAARPPHERAAGMPVSPDAGPGPDTEPGRGTASVAGSIDARRRLAGL